MLLTKEQDRALAKKLERVIVFSLAGGFASGWACASGWIVAGILLAGLGVGLAAVDWHADK